MIGRAIGGLLSALTTALVFTTALAVVWWSTASTTLAAALFAALSALSLATTATATLGRTAHSQAFHRAQHIVERFDHLDPVHIVDACQRVLRLFMLSGCVVLTVMEMILNLNILRFFCQTQLTTSTTIASRKIAAIALFMLIRSVRLCVNVP